MKSQIKRQQTNHTCALMVIILHPTFIADILLYYSAVL